MKHDELLDAIWHYCNSQNCPKTSMALRRDETSKVQKLTNVFRKHFKPDPDSGGLSFNFKLSNDRQKLRKRIQNSTSTMCTSSKPKLTKESVRKESSTVPKYFISILNELGFDLKDARKLFENKDKWTCLKSDRLVFCAEKGCEFSAIFGNQCLADHCVTEHGYQTVPCPYEDCKYEAFSQTCFKAGSLIFQI